MRIFTSLLAATLVLSGGTARAGQEEGAPTFDKDVAPILYDN